MAVNIAQDVLCSLTEEQVKQALALTSKGQCDWARDRINDWVSSQDDELPYSAHHIGKAAHELVKMMNVL